VCPRVATRISYLQKDKNRRHVDVVVAVVVVIARF
jgi:hypothetical protein